MRLNRRIVLCFAALAGMGVVAPARAEGDVSEWVSTGHARVRLIDAGKNGAARLAGLQIELDPGFLTYWRTPGEAGVPPTVVFDGSKNLRSAALAYPAPMRFDEGGSEAFGYEDDVVFPITVDPVDPHAPVLLVVALSFAVCSDLCLPAAADVRLNLHGDGGTPEAGLVADAQRRVPVPTPFGASAPLAVMSLTVDAAGHDAQIVVRAPTGSKPLLFIETTDPWYVTCGAGEPVGNGQVRFGLKVLSGAKIPASIPATLTLTTDTAAVETAVQLDVAAPTP